ncbi:MAG: ATP-dependent Clp protease adapter ClpS [Verrucomicrobia bacterium]|nr:ATP-dependent Clp protease adapter ClpS [Verrucomicrobiota bacterium]
MSTASPTLAPGVIETVTDKTKPALDRPWNVVVHNDPINLMTFVAMVFQRVFGYPRQKAERLMMEVHTRGRSIVWTGGREQAEHYVRILQQYHLWTTMEQVES